MIVSALSLPLAATAVAVIAAWGGVALLAHARHADVLVPLSGGLLIGVALFGLIPELVGDIGWLPALGLVVAGYVLVSLLDRFALAVCPHDQHHHDQHHHDQHHHDHHHHDQHHVEDAEHVRGLAIPLLLATLIHAFVDGWGLVAVQKGTHQAGATTALATALMLHKIPEGLALGTIVRASVRAVWLAAVLCATVECFTILGGAAGAWLTPPEWVSYPLAVAGGTFLFLGVHAISSDQKHRGAKPAFIPALAGGAGAALLQLGLRLAAR